MTDVTVEPLSFWPAADRGAAPSGRRAPDAGLAATVAHAQPDPTSRIPRGGSGHRGRDRVRRGPASVRVGPSGVTVMFGDRGIERRGTRRRGLGVDRRRRPRLRRSDAEPFSAVTSGADPSRCRASGGEPSGAGASVSPVPLPARSPAGSASPRRSLPSGPGGSVMPRAPRAARRYPPPDPRRASRPRPAPRRRAARRRS